MIRFAKIFLFLALLHSPFAHADKIARSHNFERNSLRCEVVLPEQATLLSPYEGECQNGLAHGHGKVSIKRKLNTGIFDISLEGVFQHGILIGFGKERGIGDKYLYEGTFNKWQRWNGIMRTGSGYRGREEQWNYTNGFGARASVGSTVDITRDPLYYAKADDTNTSVVHSEQPQQDRTGYQSKERTGIFAVPILGAFLSGFADGLPAAGSRVGEAIKDVPRDTLNRKAEELITRQEQRQREREEHKKLEEDARQNKEGETELQRSLAIQREISPPVGDCSSPSIKQGMCNQPGYCDDLRSGGQVPCSSLKPTQLEELRNKRAEALEERIRREQENKNVQAAYESKVRDDRARAARFDEEQKRQRAEQIAIQDAESKRQQQASEAWLKDYREKQARNAASTGNISGQSNVPVSPSLGAINSLPAQPSPNTQQNQVKAYTATIKPAQEIQFTAQPIAPIPLVPTHNNGLTPNEITWKNSLPTDIRQQIDQFSPDMISRMKANGHWDIFVKGINNDVTALREARKEEAMAWGIFAFDVVTLPVGELKIASFALLKGPAIAKEAVQAGRKIIDVAAEKEAGAATARAVDSANTGGINKLGNVAEGVLKGGQGYPSFQSLKKALGPAGEGKDWHHIVEQSNVDIFGSGAVHNTKNVVAVLKDVHYKISGYYSSKQLFTNNMTVREWLRSQTFEDQYQFGLDVLRRFNR